MRILIITILCFWASPVGGQIILHSDLAYGPDPAQALDLYVPQTHGLTKLPVIMYIHGGGWQSGDKSTSKKLLVQYAKTRLFAVASVNYRLAPGHVWPAQYNDCKAAVHWLRNNSVTFGLDPGNIATMGPSAGGHLALMIALRENGIRCAVSCYGPTDLWQLPPRGQRGVRALLGDSYGEAAADAASPITYVTVGDPPLQLVHGDSDPLVPLQQSQSLRQVYPNEINLITIIGGGHGGEDDVRVWSKNLAFFARHMLGRSVVVDTQAFTQ